MAGPLSKYALINAKLRARISKILPDEVFGQLAKAPSLDAALALLRDSVFADLEHIYAATGDLKSAELDLLKREIELYRGIRKHLHPGTKELVDALLAQFEIDNLKNAIRIYFDRKIRKRSVDDRTHYVLHEPIVHDLPMDAILNAEGFDEIAGLCGGTPYGAIVSKFSHTVETEGSLFRMEVALDHCYYSRLVEAINRLDRRDRDVAVRLIGVEIDLQNISWVIRLKSFYDLPLEAILTTIIPGGFHLSRSVIDELYQAQNVAATLQEFVAGKYPGLSALLAAETSSSAARLALVQRILAEIRKHEVQRILAGYPFSIGIILSYFVLKRDELQKIRMLLNAKQYGRQQERIESLL